MVNGAGVLRVRSQSTVGVQKKIVKPKYAVLCCLKILEFPQKALAIVVVVVVVVIHDEVKILLLL